MSSASADFFGKHADSIKNDLDRVDALVHPDDKEYLSDQWCQFNAQTSVVVDCRLLMPDDSVKWVHIKACKLREKGSYQGCIAGFAEDITQRKDYEQRVYKIHAQKDIALQILGHDLRSPLHTISSALDLLGQQGINSDDLIKITPYLKIIEATCQNALDLINELLKSIYWDTQSTRFKQQINLVKKIKNQLGAYRLLHKDEKSFELQTNAPVINMKTDPVKLQLILENLLTNAYKFTRDKGRIVVRLQQQTEKVLVEVTDDGVGIPDKLKPMIFEQFSKARRWGMQGEKPVGLGLHIVKTLVEQLQGTIWFTSEEGKGTSFFVELPLR